MKWKVIWRKKRLPPKWYDISRKLRVPILQPYYCRQVSDCFTHLSMIKDWCQSFTQMHPSFSSGKCPVRLLQFQFIFMKKCSSGSNKGLNNIYLTLLSLGRRGVWIDLLQHHLPSIGTFKRAPRQALFFIQICIIW